MKWLFLAMVAFFMGTMIALAQDVIPAPLFSEPNVSQEVCSTVWCQALSKFPEVNAWLIAIFTFIGLTLRASADLLGFVGKALAKAELGKWSDKLSSWSLWAAQVVGWFGGGTPKVVLEKKMEKALGQAKAQ